MFPLHRKVLQQNHTSLIQDVDLRSSNVLDRLREDGMISSNEEEVILAETGRRSQNTKLLNLLKKRDPELRPYESLKSALRPNYDFIVEKLEKSERDIETNVPTSATVDTCVHCQFTKNIVPSDVIHTLYENGVLTDDDLEELDNDKIPRLDRVNRLLNILEDKSDQEETGHQLQSSLQPKYKYLTQGYDRGKLNMYTHCQCRHRKSRKQGQHTINTIHAHTRQGQNDLSGQNSSPSFNLNIIQTHDHSVENNLLQIDCPNTAPAPSIQQCSWQEIDVLSLQSSMASLTPKDTIPFDNHSVASSSWRHLNCDTLLQHEYDQHDPCISSTHGQLDVCVDPRATCPGMIPRGAGVQYEAKRCPLEHSWVEFSHGSLNFSSNIASGHPVANVCQDLSAIQNKSKAHRTSTQYTTHNIYEHDFIGNEIIPYDHRSRVKDKRKFKRKKSKAMSIGHDEVDGNQNDGCASATQQEKKNDILDREKSLEAARRVEDSPLVQHVTRVLPNNKRLMRKCSKLWDQLFFLREKGDWVTFTAVTNKAMEHFHDNPDIKVLLYRSEMCVSTFYKNDSIKALEMFEKAIEFLPKTEMPNWHLARILPLKVELCTRSKKFDEASSLLEDAKQAMQALSPCLSTGAVYFFEAIYLGNILQCTRSDTKASENIAGQVKKCFLTAIEHYQQEEVFAIKSFLNQVYLFLALFSLGVDFKKISYIQVHSVKREDISLAEHYLNLFENHCWENSTTWSRMLFYIGRGEQHKQLDNLERSLDYYKQAKEHSEHGTFGEHIRFVDTNIELVSEKLEEQSRLRALKEQSQTVDDIMARVCESSSDSGSA